MTSNSKPQMMKPLTAASKLGIYLPAAPEEFQKRPLSRAELDELRSHPPQWLVALHANGPFPRDTVARKLGVSNSGFGRAGVADALTADEIAALLADPPEWLIRERESYVAVRQESERVKTQQAERRAATNRPARDRGI